MNSNFTSQGIVNTTNIIENKLIDKSLYINPNINTNLISGIYSVTTNKNGTMGSVINTIASIPAATIQSLAGKTLCMSYDVCAIGARYSAEQGQTSYEYTRYGIHGGISINGTTNYPFANYLNYDGKGRVYQTWTVPSATSYGDLWFSFQNFDKPASTNNNIWFIRDLKLEIGNIGTPFVLNNYNSTGECIVANNFIEI